jgi:hypothetical protein
MSDFYNPKCTEVTRRSSAYQSLPHLPKTVHTDVHSDTHITAFAKQTCFGLVDTGQRGLKGDKTAGTKMEALLSTPSRRHFGGFSIVPLLNVRLSYLS